MWNVDTGHPTSRMTTGRTEKHKETMVWSVALANDFTIISGDSRGKTCFWNAKLGTLIDAYTTHKADVLAVTFNPGQDVAYASGIDPWIMHFQPVVKKDGRSKWVKSIHRLVHTHDVRAILADEKYIYTGGVDSMLAINDVASKNVVKYPPVPHGNCVVVAEKADLVVLRYSTYLEVWKLGCCMENSAKEAPVGTVLSLASEPVKLLKLQTKDNEVIRSCEISSDGKLIGYATSTRLRVYRMDLNEEMPSLERLSPPHSEMLQVPHHLGFFTDSDENRNVAQITENSDLQILEIGEKSLTLVATLTKKELGIVAGVSHLLTYEDHAVVADYKGNIVNVDLNKKSVTSKMPLYQKAPVSSMSVDEKSGHLAVVYSNQHFVECNLQTGKYTRFSSTVQFPNQWTNSKFVTRGILQSGDRMILFDTSQIASLDKSVEYGKPSAKASKSESGKKKMGRREKSMRFTKKYEHLLHLSSLEGGELVAVEMKPQSVEAQLPPSLKQKKFGAM